MCNHYGNPQYLVMGYCTCATITSISLKKITFLWQNGADVNAKDMLKMTALHWATEHHHRDVVELLIKYGADVHAFSKFDKSAFDIALEKNNAEILVILQVLFFLYHHSILQLKLRIFRRSWIKTEFSVSYQSSTFIMSQSCDCH